MKTILAIVLCAVLGFIPATDKMVFEVVMAPNHTYTSTTTIKNIFVIDIEASEEILAAVKANGMALPTKMNQESEMVSIVTTGARSDDGSIPVEIVVTNQEMRMTMNGQPMPGQVTATDDDPMKMTGRVFGKNELKLDSITGGGADDIPNFEETMKASMEKMIQAVEFPAEPMGVGETFEQRVPFDLPMPGVGVVQMNIVSVYKLKSFDDKEGIFDIEMSMEMRGEADTTNIEMTGEGDGVYVHNREKNNMSSTSSDLDMDMRMSINGMVMTMKGNSKTIMKMDIAAN